MFKRVFRLFRNIVFLTWLVVLLTFTSISATIWGVTMTTKVASLLVQLATIKKIHGEEIANLNVRSAQKVKTLTAERARTIKAQTTRNASKIAALASKHKQEISVLTSQNAKAIATLTRENTRKLAALRSANAQKIATLTTAQTKRLQAQSARHKKTLAKTVFRTKAKARLRRAIAAVPFLGAAAFLYFEEQDREDWLAENPGKTSGDYACAVYEESIDLVADMETGANEMLASARDRLPRWARGWVKIEFPDLKSILPPCNEAETGAAPAADTPRP